MKDDMRVPKSLLVIGNGFDLSCGLRSNYLSFFKETLRSKIYPSEPEAIEKIKQDLEKYIRFVNFSYDSPNILTRTKDIDNLFILDLNIWYLLFVYKDMIYDSDWYLIENQIAIELLADHNNLNIVEKIGDTLLNIYREKRGIEGKRIPQFCKNKTKIYENEKLIGKIYELISYCLLHKDLGRLDSNNKAVFQELRETVQRLGDEYRELSSQDKINSSPYFEMFEQKITSVLFPLVARALLAELNELEGDFRNYLRECTSTFTSRITYTENAELYFRRILAPVNVDRGYSDIVDFNILSFNYTIPWETPNNKIFEKVFDSINIHGQISNSDGIIFGIDDEKIAPTQNEFIFSKVSRTLDLITLSNHRKNFEELLSTSIENVVFYGHSLSIADYGYFRMIFDKYIENSEVKFYFTFIVYEGTTEDKERKKLVKSISELFGKYSIDKEKNTDIFKNLIQNQRIKIISLPI
ncbi:lmo0472 [Streptococcus pneumoniae]|nr:lmo0472 [Streptococcus pneumoniae]CVX72506.1 lmo0472 [Streptococcus pneumoniae]